MSASDHNLPTVRYTGSSSSYSCLAASASYIASAAASSMYFKQDSGETGMAHDIKPLAVRRRPASKPLSLAALADAAALAEPAPTPSRPAARRQLAITSVRSPSVAAPWSAMLGRLAESFTQGVTLRSAPSASPLSPHTFLGPIRTRSSISEVKTPMTESAWSPYSAHSSFSSVSQLFTPPRDQPGLRSGLGSPVRLFVAPSPSPHRTSESERMDVEGSPERSFMAQVPISRHAQRGGARPASTRHHPYCPSTPVASRAPPTERVTVACPPAPRRNRPTLDAETRPRARSSPGPHPAFARKLEFDAPVHPWPGLDQALDSPIAIGARVAAPPPTPLVSRSAFLSPRARPSVPVASQARRDELARLRARVDELERLESEADFDFVSASMGGQLGMRRGREVQPLRLAW